VGRAWHVARPHRSQPALPRPTTGGLYNCHTRPRDSSKASPRNQSARTWAEEKSDRQTGSWTDAESDNHGDRHVALEAQIVHDYCAGAGLKRKNEMLRHRWRGTFHTGVWETLSGVISLLCFLLAPVVNTVGWSWSWLLWLLCVCVCVCVFVCVSVCVCVCECVFVCVCENKTDAHANGHKHVHIYIYIRT